MLKVSQLRSLRGRGPSDSLSLKPLLLFYSDSLTIKFLFSEHYQYVQYHVSESHRWRALSRCRAGGSPGVSHYLAVRKINLLQSTLDY